MVFFTLIAIVVVVNGVTHCPLVLAVNLAELVNGVTATDAFRMAVVADVYLTIRTTDGVLDAPSAFLAGHWLAVTNACVTEELMVVVGIHSCPPTMKSALYTIWDPLLVVSSGCRC